MDKEEALKLIGKECRSKCYPDDYNKGMIVGYTKSSTYDNFVIAIIGYYTNYDVRWHNLDETDIIVINSPMIKSYGYALLSEIILIE